MMASFFTRPSCGLPMVACATGACTRSGSHCGEPSEYLQTMQPRLALVKNPVAPIRSAAPAQSNSLEPRWWFIAVARPEVQRLAFAR
jgi:hypothetical protein